MTLQQQLEEAQAMVTICRNAVQSAETKPKTRIDIRKRRENLEFWGNRLACLESQVAEVTR